MQGLKDGTLLLYIMLGSIGKEKTMISLFRRLILVGVFCLVLAGFGTIAYIIHKAQDPEQYLIKTLVDENQNIAKAFFAPDDDIKSLLISLIAAEKKRICVAIYTLTYKDIAQAFVSAHKRGVRVECVVDPGYGGDRYSKVSLLANDKIPVWVYQTGADREASLMHNKFCVFEDNIMNKTIVWTGSYNFTVRATTRNQENVLIIDNKRIAEQYLKQFEVLKTRSLLISGPQGAYRSETVNRGLDTKGLQSLWRELRRWLPI